MPAKPILGLTTCPDCDFPDAHVKADKSGHPYRYCPDCNAQYFTRGDPVRVANLQKRMRAAPNQAAADVAKGADPGAEKGKPESAPAKAAPAKRATLFG